MKSNKFYSICILFLCLLCSAPQFHVQKQSDDSSGKVKFRTVNNFLECPRSVYRISFDVEKVVAKDIAYHIILGYSGDRRLMINENRPIFIQINGKKGSVHASVVDIKTVKLDIGRVYETITIKIQPADLVKIALAKQAKLLINGKYDPVIAEFTPENLRRIGAFLKKYLKKSELNIK